MIKLYFFVKFKQSNDTMATNVIVNILYTVFIIKSKFTLVHIYW